MKQFPKKTGLQAPECFGRCLERLEILDRALIPGDSGVLGMVPHFARIPGRPRLVAQPQAPPRASESCERPPPATGSNIRIPAGAVRPGFGKETARELCGWDPRSDGATKPLKPSPPVARSSTSTKARSMVFAGALNSADLCPMISTNNSPRLVCRQGLNLPCHIRRGPNRGSFVSSKLNEWLHGLKEKHQNGSSQTKMLKWLKPDPCFHKDTNGREVFKGKVKVGKKLESGEGWCALWHGAYGWRDWCFFRQRSQARRTFATPALR